MTVVVAVSCANGTVVMGGDSFCGDENILDICRAEKVYAVGPVGVGICGMVRSEQILERVLKEHILEKKNITEEWLRTELTDYVHEAMKEHGVCQDKDGVHEMKESAYLLTFNGKIYHFDEDFSLWDSRRPIAAVGAGRLIAVGAMGALLHKAETEASTVSRFADISVQLATDMVHTALITSAEWSPWVCSPFSIITIPPLSEFEEE